MIYTMSSKNVENILEIRRNEIVMHDELVDYEILHFSVLSFFKSTESLCPHFDINP